MIASNENVISADEMTVATNPKEPVTPAKFLPYRKLCAGMKEIVESLEGACDDIEKLNALFEVTNGYLGRAGSELAVIYGTRLFELKERAELLLGSALLTLPRKRWDDSGCVDDRPDIVDLQKEKAAAVATAAAQD